MSRFRQGMASTCAIAAALASASAIAQPTLPEVLQGSAASEVPVTVQNLRWIMLEQPFSSLTFRSMDRLFTTRSVPRAGQPWVLPQASHPLDFSYNFEGNTYSALEGIERTYTNAILVLKDGRVVYEAYRNNSGPSDRFMGWSATKSLVSILVGVAVEQDLITSLDDPIDRYLPELGSGGYRGVTIRQVLQMRSGVDYEERYDFANPGAASSNHIGALIQNRQRFADAAQTIERKAAPGTLFEYKTLDTAVLGLLIERVSGMALASYMTTNLWEPLGAEADGFFIMDGAPGTGREFSGAGFNATLRDFGRVGQLMLDGGMANGQRIVSADWVAQSTRPTEPVPDPQLGYGMQWWTLGGHAYAAIGLQGQYIFVDPTTRTVVVKLSYFPPQDEQVYLETQAFLRAASAWEPR
jgi:CubicO group peptidase (beta-lactamase class C family)